jgi:CHAT domain-containing protein
MAGELKEMGEYAAALRELNRARDVQEAEEDFFELTLTVAWIGNVYERLGDRAKALDAYQEARRLGEESGNAREAANSMLDIGWVYAEMGLADRALEAYEEALAAFEEMGNPDGIRVGTLNKALLNEEQGDPARALELFEKVLELDRELGLLREQAEDHAHIGYTLAGMDRLEDGLESYRAGLAIALELGHRDAIWPCYLGMADCFEQGGVLDSARVYNALAIEAMETQRGRALSAESRTAFLGKRAFVYEAQIHVLARLHEKEPSGSFGADAFRVAERGRARALLDMLAEGRVDLDAGMDPALVAERRRQDRALASVRYRLRLAGEEEIPADSLRALKRELRALEREQAFLLEQMRLSDPRFASLDTGEPAGLDEVRSRLLRSEDHLLLEYALGDSASYLWVVTNEDLALHRLPPRPVIETEAQALRSHLKNPAPSGDAALVEAAEALFGTILEPAAKALEDAETVYIVPDGALHFIPFAALLAEKPSPPDPEADALSRNQYFSRLPFAFRKTPVYYGPSATSLVMLASRRSQNPPAAPVAFLGVGDPVFSSDSSAVPSEENGLSTGLVPLPFTRNEVETIAGLFEPDQRTVLLGEDAAERTLVEPGYLARHRILHFATHGLIDERRPERSSLALSFPREATEDGLLQASEIYRLRVEASLVVLSACETGVGRMVRGEGVLGLPRAFFYAGAPQVLVSLWSVSDRSTSQLMSAFYTELVRKDRTEGEALLRAKEKLRRSDTFAHPFYWAPFVLMGAP